VNEQGSRFERTEQPFCVAHQYRMLHCSRCLQAGEPVEIVEELLLWRGIALGPVRQSIRHESPLVRAAAHPDDDCLLSALASSRLGPLLVPAPPGAAERTRRPMASLRKSIDDRESS
jgi:hypothetical protein